MERRVSIRKPVDVRVYLSCAGHRAVRCTAVDISHGGIYVKTDQLYLPRDKRLNLMFALHTDSSNIIHMRQIKAVVKRSEIDGVGMAFCKAQSRASTPSSHAGN